MIIIPLLSSAVSQFKKYKCPRMKRQLTVEMGEEYYSYKDYCKALTLLKHVLWDYRVEKWRPIVSSILWTALKCSYLSANVQDYIFLGLEAISYWMLRSSEEKSTIQLSLKNLIQGRKPGVFPGLTEEEMQEAEIRWAENLPTVQSPSLFTLQMSSIIPFVECKAGLECKEYIVDQKVTVIVRIRMNCPQPMSFTKLAVLFNKPHYNQFCEVPSLNQKGEGIDKNINSFQINLVPRNVHAYSFSFILDPNDIDSSIQITSVALHLGSESSLGVVLHWINNIPICVSIPIPPIQFIPKAASFSDDPTFQHIMSHPSAKIVPRNARIKLSIEHDSPALIDEFYVFRIEIVNEESTCINNVLLSVTLTPGQPQIIFENTHICEECLPPTKFVQYLPEMALKDMAPGEKISKKIYLKASTVGSRQMLFEVNYDIDVELDEQMLHYVCKKLEDLEINVVEPFEFSVKILNMKYQEQSSIHAEEPFLLRIDITSCSNISVNLEDANLGLGKDVYAIDEAITSEVQDLSLMPEEAGTECFCLVTQQDCPSAIPLGVYNLKWKRKSSLDDFSVVETAVNLPIVNVISPPIYMELEYPAHGWVCTPMTVTYLVHNRLTSVQDVEILVDSSDAFMYSGNKQMHFKVLPRDKYKLLYNLYPLVSGYVPLPRLRMTLNPQTSCALSVDELIRDMIPTHIFVMPQGKGDVCDKSVP